MTRANPGLAAGGRTRVPHWVSYDGVAEAYERYHVRKGYALVARDLVLMLELADGATVLDVGTGSGEAALIAQGRCSHGVIVGLDPSIPMLRVAAKKGLKLAVAGAAPGLPLRSARFDAAMASLVITHFPSYENALADMVRVLKPGGKLGVTAWASSTSEFAGLWRRTAESFVGKKELQRASSAHVPWSDWFEDPKHIEAALAGAGMREIRLEHREYQVSITAAELLSRIESGLIGRWMSHTMEPARWVNFRHVVAQQFANHFPSRFTLSAEAHLAVAVR